VPHLAKGTRVKTILNILWFVLSGLWMAVAYVVFGTIACITIIGIPFGVAAFRIANYALWPFGRTVVRRPDAGGFSALGNVVWVLVAGLWLAIGHLFSGVLLCITIIGIPFGIANFKMIPISLLPLGRQIVRIGQPYGQPYAQG
jgi:uncharacterized membrane protein YccF (DUF307 family)